MESMGRKKPPPRRSCTPEFKAEIVELCHRGNRYLRLVFANEPAKRLTDLRDRFDTALS